jgi:ubiquitin-conjugating enzyme E2 J1
MSPTIRRLMKEAAELSESSPSPSPHFCAHPVSDSNLFDWHFTMAGPPAPSAYAGGIYHGRIVLPPTYPLRPPSFRFLTPSGRFEVNREICLSISGHHEETWQPAWGIRTALTAIRSFMDGDAKGQLGGLDAPEDVRKMWAQKSRSWRCECMNGNTNEQVLNEWREMCAQKGISVDDQDRETVPDELKMSYKKKSDENNSPSPPTVTTDTKERPSTTPTEANTESTRRTSLTAPTQPQAPLIQNPTNTTNITAGRITPPSTEPSEAFSNPQATSPIAPRPTPTVAAATTTTTRRQTTLQRNSLQDGPWLDRAIVGVIIALVFMILRRIAASEDI